MKARLGALQLEGRPDELARYFCLFQKLRDGEITPSKHLTLMRKAVNQAYEIVEKAEKSKGE